MRYSRIIYGIVAIIIFASCNSSTDKIKRNIEEMSSSPISIPFEKMKCMTRDPLSVKAPWRNARIKLVHYVDSIQCSSCYLQKIKQNHNDLLLIEKEVKNDFYNIFILDPRSNKTSLIKLMAEFDNNETPPTIFIDTAHVFMDTNNKIPKEIIYHTFLLDDNNNIIFVGNPLANEGIKKKMVSIINERVRTVK